MVKAPYLGRNKTRLAVDLGAVPTWSFYKTLLAYTVRRLRRVSKWTLWLAVTPNKAIYSDRLWPKNTNRIQQGYGDLGQRMKSIFNLLPVGPTIIIGSDIPQIKASHIEAGFQALGHHDAVFGPTKDGGFWLVGLKRRPYLVDLFKDVRWSCPHSLSDTRDNLPKHMNVLTIEELIDIDDIKDLRVFTNRNKKCINYALDLPHQ